MEYEIARGNDSPKLLESARRTIRERCLQSIMTEGAEAKKLTLRFDDFPGETVLDIVGYHGKEDNNYLLQVNHNGEVLWI